MPHDANGNLLTVGDKVVIPGTVTQICEGEDYCNVTIETEYPMPPYDAKYMLSAINTRQVLKVKNAPDHTRCYPGGK